MNKKKVLLGHLNSNGDCLFATVIARQIKEVDYPDCHLTWAVNSKSKQSVLLNPYVDEIWEIPTKTSLTSAEEWKNFVSEVSSRKENGDFDEVFLTQIIGDNILNYDGGIRSSIYNNYPHKITVSHQPVIILSEAEIENVAGFAEKHQLTQYERVILVECGPDSFDASLNPQSAYEMALRISENFPDTAFILSSNKKISSTHSNIIDGSELTFRENAELSKYCSLFVGCSSGISWLLTTGWAKKLNMILLINEKNQVLPSMIYDHKYIDLPTNHLIEIVESSYTMEEIENCLKQTLKFGFAESRKIFNRKINITNHSYFVYQVDLALFKSSIYEVFIHLKKYYKRNGFGVFLSKSFRQVCYRYKNIILSKILRLVDIRKNVKSF